MLILREQCSVKIIMIIIKEKKIEFGRILLGRLATSPLTKRHRLWQKWNIKLGIGKVRQQCLHVNVHLSWLFPGRWTRLDLQCDHQRAFKKKDIALVQMKNLFTINKKEDKSTQPWRLKFAFIKKVHKIYLNNDTPVWHDKGSLLEIALQLPESNSHTHTHEHTLNEKGKEKVWKAIKCFLLVCATSET